MRKEQGIFVRFLHPDLGIGGAERLVLDLARAVNENSSDPYATSKYQNNKIEICTNNWQKDRCFPETQPLPPPQTNPYHPKTLFQFIPRSISGKCFALLAYLKMILASLIIGFFYAPSEILIIDQVSHCIPTFLLANFIQTLILSILTFRFRRRTKILFYCHWPDQLLAKYNLHGQGARLQIYKSYRFFMDTWEKWTIKLSDKILVNSNFTAKVVSKTLGIEMAKLDILYPALSLNSGSSDENTKNLFKTLAPSNSLLKKFQEFNIMDENGKFLNFTQKILLSINRYERKKNITLAIEAVGHLGKAKRPILIIAGGFDLREKENIEYKLDLEKLVETHKLGNSTIFLTNISDTEKTYLLSIADCLIYTPKNEHFGIVPLEAMACGTPVVAMKSGGPIETVPKNIGRLVPHNTEKENKHLVGNTALAIEEILEDCQTFVADCKAHVRNNFSFDSFQGKLLAVLEEMLKERFSKKKKSK